MTNTISPVDQQEHRAVIAVCVLAAFADGAQGEDERARIQQIANAFNGAALDPAPVYQEVLSGNTTLAAAAGQIQSSQGRALAYEMAVCVCNVDGVVTANEKKFLSDLHQALHLDSAATAVHQQTAQSLVTLPPVIGAAPLASAPVNTNREADIDKMILNASILNGALEMMPHTLATMAIVPLQMRLVYQIGNRYGYQLDSGHIKEFLATVGVGLTSQVFEGFTRRLVGGFAGGLVGGLLGGLVKEATGSAVGFASTYALGQVARRYYASGRTLSTQQLKDVFSSMLNQGRSMQSGYSSDIAARARSVNVSDLLPLVSGR